MQLLTNEGPSVQEGKEGEHPSHLLLKDKFILFKKGREGGRLCQKHTAKRILERLGIQTSSSFVQI